MANAKVDLSSSSPLSQGYLLFTDAAGTADFPRVLAGTITAVGSVPALNQAGQAMGVLTSGGTLTLNVTLGAAGTVTGTVRLPAGTPVAGVNVCDRCA